MGWGTFRKSWEGSSRPEPPLSKMEVLNMQWDGALGAECLGICVISVT